MKLGSSYHAHFATSEIVQISTEGVEQLEIYFGKYVPQFFYSLFAPLTLFLIVGGMSLKIAVVLLLCVPLIPVSIVAVQKFAKKLLAKYWGSYTELGDSFLENLQGLTTLKIYQADERYAKKMDEVLEDQSLYWNDDKEIVDTFVLKTIKRFDEKNGAKQELLPEFKDEEDQDFARRLFRRTILNADYYRHLISENTKNWDLDRVAFMDVVIMQIALAEILSFPNIPVSVSLNEYVEIAKLYSSPKSGGFINGTLDGIVNSLKKENKLTKN